MPTDVVMPQMGESIFEGAISKWLKKPGEAVRKDEPLFEISTDKVDAEIPSPADGVLLEIRAHEGETVAINTVVAVIAEKGAAQIPEKPASPEQKPAQESTLAKLAPPQVAPKAESAPPQVAPTQVAQVVEGRRIRSSPLVRRMASERHLDLSEIPGTGSEGRVTKEDVQLFLSQRKAAVSTPVAQEEPASAQTAPKDGELKTMTRMRAIIAERMVESVRTIPHVYSIYKIDMTRVARLRERAKEAYEQRHGVKLTYMPFIAAAAVAALEKYPIVNATVEGAAIRHRRHVNLGIAVALDWGLLVPVVKHAEEMSFLGLARAIADLAARARTKKLKPEEAQGSTFTLTNSGVWGGEFGTPIINQPDSAILGVGGLKKEPVVVTGADGEDTIAIRWMQHFCLGFDHRLIDGADAGKFISEFQRILENWEREIG